MAKHPAPTDYASVARAALDRLKAKTVERLKTVVAKPAEKKAMRLTFDITWNGHHELSVYCAPFGENWEYTTHSNPFGQLLAVEPPSGQQDNPNGFAAEKPAVGRLVLDALADWWAEAGGAGYALAVVGTTTVEPLRLFDFATRKWLTDEAAIRRQTLTTEFEALIRARYQDLRPAVAERLRKAIAKLGNGPLEFQVEVFFDDEFEVMYGVAHGAKSGNGRLFPPAGQLAQLLKGDTFHEDRERYGELGVDVEAVRKAALEEFVADVWEDAAGPGRTAAARLSYHDDGAEYDLVARRWVTDFLGRPLAR